jgi:hypothetical protein
MFLQCHLIVPSSTITSVVSVIHIDCLLIVWDKINGYFSTLFTILPRYQRPKRVNRVESIFRTLDSFSVSGIAPYSTDRCGELKILEKMLFFLKKHISTEWLSAYNSMKAMFGHYFRCT